LLSLRLYHLETACHIRKIPQSSRGLSRRVINFWLWAEFLACFQAAAALARRKKKKARGLI
jgi:hypothetical protein